MTTPAAATDTARGRSYNIHGVQVPSVTTVLQTLSKQALLGSAVKITARAAIEQYGTLGMMIGEEGPDAAESWLKSIYRDEWNGKRDAGTAVHHGIHQDILGTPLWPTKYPGHQLQWERFQRDRKPVFEMAEATVFSLRPAHAGTLDMLVRIGPDLWLLDVKTGGIFLEVILQLAAYLFSPTILLPDGTDAPKPAVDRVGVLQLLDDDYRLIELPEVGERAYKHFTYLLALYNWQRTIDGQIGVEV